MTSLERQLASLRTATAQQLTVERQHVSLLFEAKEAKSLDRDTVYKIGCTGLSQLKKLDPATFDVPNELFDETALDVQRTLMTKEENERVNGVIETFLVKLAPYMQHFACQQALEWLVYKYHIYSYNAEAFLTSFIAFHDTNFFGRILRVLTIQWESNKDWGFFGEFAKKQIPVPFVTLVKYTLSSQHSILTKLAEHIDNGIKLVGEAWLEQKAAVLFTFYAKLLLAAIEQAERVDDQLVAKLMPLVANGLKSGVASFRQAALMVVCQLSLAVKLTDNVISSISKLIIMKMKDSSLSVSVSTLAVMCQNQKIESFSNKAVMKLLRRDAAQPWLECVAVLASQADVAPLVVPLVRSLLEIDSDDEDVSKAVVDSIVRLLELVNSGKTAKEVMRMLLHHIESGKSLHKKVAKVVAPLVTRFSDEFDVVREECAKRNAADAFMAWVDQCQLQQLLLVVQQENKKKLRQRRRSESKTEKEQPKSEEALKKASAEDALNALMDGADSVRKGRFEGDPLKKAAKWAEKADWDKFAWAMDEIVSRGAAKYFAGKLEEEVEDFIVDMLKRYVDDDKNVIPADKMKSALADAPMSPALIVALVSRQEDTGSDAKRARTSAAQPLAKQFKGESDGVWNRRVQWGAELLSCRQKIEPSSALFAALFHLVKQADVESSTDAASKQHYSIQQLAITIIVKLLRNPGKYAVSAADLQMECVVETMRTTISHHVLRESLRLLTAAVKVSPSSVTAHVMSVFTFMGSGLLRKDNDLTLGIIEDTLHALYSAIIAGDGRKDVSSALVEVTRVLAAAAVDIPAHRRARMASAIARAVGGKYVWLVSAVLIEGYCAKWQRSSGVELSASARLVRGSEQDAYEDIACEMVAYLGAVEQLEAVLDLVQFAVRLGGDKGKGKATALDSAVFDRQKHSPQKLRHFRFVTVGLVVKVLSNRQLYEKLAGNADDELYEAILPVGHRLLAASVELDEFAHSEAKIADAAGETAEAAATQRYWAAFGSRAETVADKLRHLLPGSVSARLIAAVLEDDQTEWRMREKALMLANVKLLADGYFHSDGGINEQQLCRLAKVLNQWIAPERSDGNKVLLCQQAAYSLKLVAKRLPQQSENEVLSETMRRCAETVAKWETLDECLVGNVLLLAGELVRSHNMRSTMLSAQPLLAVCCAILNELHDKTKQAVSKPVEGSAVPRRQRIRQQSLGGRRLGADTMLICALTCLQRLLDQFAPFAAAHIPTVLMHTSRLASRYGENVEVAPSATGVVPSAPAGQAASTVPLTPQQLQQQQNRSNIQHRLSLIRKALLKVEYRLVPDYFAKAVAELRAEEKPLCSLFSLLSSFFDITKGRDIATPTLRQKMVGDVFIAALGFRSLQRQPELFETVSCVERAVFSSIVSMAEQLSETELRPVMNQLVAWAEAALSPAAPRAERLKMVTLFHFANHFYRAFQQLSLPYFARVVEIGAVVLRGCNANATSESELFLSGKKDSLEGLETDLLLTETIDLVANLARHKDFISEERAALLEEPLVGEIGNSRVAGHEKRCVPHLAEALYRVAECQTEMFGGILQGVLMHTRSSKAKIRYRSLLVLEQIVDRVGDSIAPHLPTLMPFLSELLEDENKNVEEQCDKIVRLLQRKFGSDISDGFAP